MGNSASTWRLAIAAERQRVSERDADFGTRQAARSPKLVQQALDESGAHLGHISRDRAIARNEYRVWRSSRLREVRSC